LFLAVFSKSTPIYGSILYIISYNTIYRGIKTVEFGGNAENGKFKIAGRACFLACNGIVEGN